MEYIYNFTKYLYTIGYQQKTIKCKTEHLTFFFEYLKKQPPIQVNGKTIQDYYDHLAVEKAHCKLVTINQYMTTTKQFYNWLEVTNQITAHPFSKIKLKKYKQTYIRKPIPENQIFTLWKNTIHDYEKLILIFAYGCGLRSGELQQIQLQHINFTTGILTVAKGKNNKRRYIPIQAIHLNFLYHYKTKLALAPKDTLFTVKAYTINTYFKNMQERLGYKRPYCTLHHLRHSIASHLIDRGLNIELVQYFLGHTTLKTTQIYVTPIKTIQT